MESEEEKTKRWQKAIDKHRDNQLRANKEFKEQLENYIKILRKQQGKK